MGCSVRCWLGTQLHWLWLWLWSGLAICILDLGFDSKLTTQASCDRRAHSFGSLNVWNTFVHIWDDLVFVALGERVKIFDLPSVYRVCACVRVCLCVCSHSNLTTIDPCHWAICRQTVAALKPIRNPKLVLCKLRTNCSVSWNNTSTSSQFHRVGKFFLHYTRYGKYVLYIIECWIFLCFFLESVGLTQWADSSWLT